MKFSCNQQILSKALNTVSKAVTIRTTIPILKGILLKVTEDGKLTLSASDLDLSISKNIDVAVKEAGSIIVSAKLFGDIIRKLPNEEIFFEVEENDNVAIKTSASEFNIVGLPAEEFPNVGEIEETSSKLSFEKDMLREMINRTHFAASIDEAKGIIVGVLIEIDEEGITMAALDSFRMAVARKKTKNEKEEKIVVAAKMLNEISKILADTEGKEEVTVFLSEKKAIVLFERTKISLRLLEGEFIKYKEIIPKDNKTKVKVNKNNLFESIERASLLAKEGKNNLIKMSFDESKLTITSRSEEGNVKEEIEIEKEGENIEIGFNSKYVIDALKAIDEEDIMIELNTSTTPCLLRPVEGNDFEYLVLPVRISSN